MSNQLTTKINKYQFKLTTAIAPTKRAVYQSKINRYTQKLNQFNNLSTINITQKGGTTERDIENKNRQINEILDALQGTITTQQRVLSEKCITINTLNDKLSARIKQQQEETTKRITKLQAINEPLQKFNEQIVNLISDPTFRVEELKRLNL